jgi:hypothetical protein
MIGQLGILMMSFRDAFPRGATFHWFVVAIFGFIVRLDHHGVSSSIRWLRVRDDLYETFLAFFRSDAVKLGTVRRHWQLLVAKRYAMRTRGWGACADRRRDQGGQFHARRQKAAPGIRELRESSLDIRASLRCGRHAGGDYGKAFLHPPCR